MITIQKATVDHVKGIVHVCVAASWATYDGLLSHDYIERMMNELYTYDRVLNEVTTTNRRWHGWVVALDAGEVVGAGAGGMFSENHGELFALYVDPHRRNKGLGTAILEEITKELTRYGAKEQWVSVTKYNEKAIPFYNAKGFNFIHEQDEYGIIEGENYQALRYHRKLN